MVKKHRETILTCISDTKLKSTTEILRETEGRVNKKINWSDLYRTLIDLEDKGLIIKHETKGGFFWQKRNV